MPRNPGPHYGSAEDEGGRTGAAVAAPRCRCESTRFSSPHSASRPEGEGTRAAAARTGTSLARFPPSTRASPQRCLPPPLPQCALGRSTQARWGYLLRDRPARKPYPSASLPRLRRQDPAPYAQLPCRRHLGKVDARLTAKASGGRRPADAMTKRSRRVKTPPPG